MMLDCSACGKITNGSCHVEYNGKYIILCSGCYKKTCADCRNGRLDPDNSPGRGYISEILVAKFPGIKTCFDITNNFNYPKYDLLEHEDWGLINAKGSKLHYGDNHKFAINKNKKANFFFCTGYDEFWRHILAVYYIPNDEYINKLARLHINMKWSLEENPYYWFKEDPKPWDELFHTLKLDDCPVLKSRKVT